MALKAVTLAVALVACGGAAPANDAARALARGLAFDFGQGEAQDSRQAFGWYWRAAMAGLPEAEFNLAVMFDGGRGVGQDLGQAALWYGRAAAHGNARAEFNLGQLYAAGLGVPRNPSIAAAWFRAAAKDGVVAAANRIAAQEPDSATAAPVAAVPSPARLLSAPDTVRAEFVWSPPAQPTPTTYLVTVVAIDASGLHPLWAQATDRSALLADLPRTDDQLVWRVYAVSDRARHYTASPWGPLQATAPAMPAPGTELSRPAAPTSSGR